MTPEEVLSELKATINHKMDITQCISQFVNHYERTMIDDCGKEYDGDMLLFQWDGPNSWDKYFTINLTRQLSYLDDNDEYDSMKQLCMALQFDPKLVSLESGNFWCENNDVASFLSKALNSDAVTGINGLMIISIEWELENV